MWDTSIDYRLIVAEKSVDLFLRTIEGANLRGKWNKRQSLNCARNMLPVIQSLYYSYLNPEEIAQSPQLEALEENNNDIIISLGGNNWSGQFLEQVDGDEREKLEEAIAKIKFFLNTISGLRHRFQLGQIKDPVIGVDIKTGIISSVGKHLSTDKLLICNVNLGEKAVTVITNDLTVKEGNQVAVALLPPTSFRGVTSEGMFLGTDKGVLKDVSGDLGGLPHGIPLEALNETRNLVDAFLR